MTISTRVSGFPVLLKSHDRPGISGLLKVDDEHARLVTVDDLIALLNKKLAAAGGGNDQVDQLVCSVHLYGERLARARPLAPLLLDKAGSIRHLVAHTVPRRNKTIYVRTLTGATEEFECAPDASVMDLKQFVWDRMGIPPDHQRFVYDKRRLEEGRLLCDYGIKEGCKLHLVLRLRGGFTGSSPVPSPKTFADVSNGSILVEREFSKSAPEWRVCSKGLNIEGRCETASCKAFKKLVIHRQGFEPFNLIEDKTAACPVCHKPIKPATCGFYDCFWKFDGVKESDGYFVSSPWTEALGKKYHRFDDQKTDGSVSWKSLLIVAKSGDTALPTVDRSTQPRNVCPICMEGDGQLVTKRCGHCYHKSCAQVWYAMNQHLHGIVSCPVCHMQL